MANEDVGRQLLRHAKLAGVKLVDGDVHEAITENLWKIIDGLSNNFAQANTENERLRKVLSKIMECVNNSRGEGGDPDGYGSMLALTHIESMACAALEETP